MESESRHGEPDDSSLLPSLPELPEGWEQEVTPEIAEKLQTLFTWMQRHIENLNRMGEGIEEVDALVSPLIEERNRAAAIAMHASLEGDIRDAIRADFRGDEHATRLIGDDKNPGVLGFSDQCKLAHCLGLFGDRALTDLSTLTRVRNLFAHSRQPMTFGTQQIKDLCANLKTLEVATRRSEGPIAKLLGARCYPPGNDAAKQFVCSRCLGS
jgi:hypothetical protein